MKYFSLMLLLFALPAFADDSWLCIGDYVAFVGNKDGRVTGSEAGRADWKYLVDENGVKEFGSETYFLDHCLWFEGRPGSCEYSERRYWRGRFSMSPDHVFELIFIKVKDSGEVTTYLLQGKCSQL